MCELLGFGMLFQASGTESFSLLTLRDALAFIIDLTGWTVATAFHMIVLYAGIIGWLLLLCLSCAPWW